MYDAGSTRVRVASASTSISYSVTSTEGAKLRSGSLAVQNGAASLDLTTLGPGYYTVSVSSPNGSASTGVGVVAGLSRTPTASPFGTSQHPAYHSGPDATAADAMLGFRTVRIDWSWENMATAGSTYNWDAKGSAEITRLKARGIKPVLVLAYHGLCDGGRTPSSAQCIKQYADFVLATARKFGSTVDYAVYNEFNAPTTNGTCGRTADCYMQLLKPASQAIRSAAPGARVLGPALGAIDDWWAVGGDAYLWFQRFVKLGGHNFVDVITIHNYSLASAPEGHGELAMANAKAVLKAAGSTKDVVMEETGYATPRGGLPENVQAVFHVRDAAAVLAAGAKTYMPYTLVDDWNAPTDPQSNFGLFRHEDANGGRLVPKPAAVSQAVMARMLNGARFVKSEALGAGTRSMVFRMADSRTVRIIWTTDQLRSLVLNGAGTVAATDIYGRTVQPSVAGTATYYTIGGFPIFITSTTQGTATQG